MTAHFSDKLHLDKCTKCRAFYYRTQLAKPDGRRSWFCERCWERLMLGKWPKPSESGEK
jgi:hypothetical protein